MRFYRINMYIDMECKEDEESQNTRKSRKLIDRTFAESIAAKSEKYAEKIADKGYLFLGCTTQALCVFGMIIRENMDVEKYMNNYPNHTHIGVNEIDIRETTLNDFVQLLNEADRNGYIYDDYEVLREYELTELIRSNHRGGRISYSEDMIKVRNREAICLSAKTYFTKETFIPELDRIFTKTNRKKVYGHPVDYLIETDDERTQTGMIQLLLQALYSVGRIENRRYCTLDVEPDMNFSKRAAEALYKSCVGGTVIVDFYTYEEDDDDLAHGEYSFMEDLCSIIKRHCCDVLTVLCLPRECKNLKAKIFENTEKCTFVEIKESLAVDDEAVMYLKRRAKEYKVRTDKQLLQSIEKGNGYLTPDLNAIFDEWYSRKLKNTIYSQYKDFSDAKVESIKRKPKGAAFDELESMIGLTSAKNVIYQALDSYKAQKIFKDKGMMEDTSCNHMIFTGNPGTAKTTVARLFARILKDNEVLSRGHILEVGRGDLVGKYVGWTAQIIKKRFKDAIGGILFIDEAYSLVDDRNGSFGDEAINTIVQEMENHRDDVIVIFAGYPDKMEGFLDKNPGLRSRIAHYIHFEDYNSDELCQIAEFIASQKGLELDDGARKKIKIIMDNAREQADFGNGRFVRNVIEKAKMAQNCRLVRMDYDSVTIDDVKRICAEDIVIPMNESKKTNHRIGFAV